MAKCPVLGICWDRIVESGVGLRAVSRFGFVVVVILSNSSSPSSAATVARFRRQSLIFFLNHHHQHSLPPQATTWLGLRPRPGQYRGSSQWERPDRGKESGDLGLGRIGVLSSVVKRVDESGLSGGGFVFLILFLNFNEQHHDDCGDDVWGLQRRIEEKTEEEEDLVMMHVRCSMICLRRVGMTVVLDCIEDGCIEGAWLWGWFAEPKHDRDRNDERGHGASQIFSRGMTEGNDESRMLWLQTRS
ncbi:hypothetical protein Droror1_Dr00022490 [Drosera rotundifolia]